MRPDVSVICAVWHRQQDKESLLAGHHRNLVAASAARVVYVFDGDDRPPDWLREEARVSSISVSDALPIYHAWNVALSMVTTPLVMNLNLDDRLATDAIDRMAAPFDTDPDVFLVGGDWQITYDEDETDRVGVSLPIGQVPFRDEWPPAPGSVARLGSGDGRRETHGPACMWRLEAHRRLPRYPYRFADGTPIRVVGDAIWWHAIEHMMRKKIVRLPWIVGNYRSHPQSQAEFRYDAAAELAKQNISLM